MSSFTNSKSRWLTTILLVPLVAAAPLPSETNPSPSNSPSPSTTFSPSTAPFLATPSLTTTASSSSTSTSTSVDLQAALTAMPTATPIDSADIAGIQSVLLVPDSITDTVTLGPIATALPTAAARDDTATGTSSWAAAPMFSNMESFSVSAYAAGASNLAVLSGSPEPSSSSSSNPSLSSTATSMPYGNDTGTVDAASFSMATGGEVWGRTHNSLQVFYPKGSINPGNSPQGGTEFYARPLESITQATNASLEYSVYFPADFDFVKGGKLPGLYGGHKGCSGGNAAEDCFSTRLMWRTGGLGELYLYAPKDKQTPSLCQTKPKSICDAAYGLSIGRGAWKFALGDWTTIRQDVWLNTPGQNDGGFNIWINGRLVLTASDVRYRENAETCVQGEGSDTINALSGTGTDANGTISASVDEDWQTAKGKAEEESEMAKNAEAGTSVSMSTFTATATSINTITMTVTSTLPHSMSASAISSTSTQTSNPLKKRQDEDEEPPADDPPAEEEPEPQPEVTAVITIPITEPITAVQTVTSQITVPTTAFVTVPSTVVVTHTQPTTVVPPITTVYFTQTATATATATATRTETSVRTATATATLVAKPTRAIVYKPIIVHPQPVIVHVPRPASTLLPNTQPMIIKAPQVKIITLPSPPPPPSQPHPVTTHKSSVDGCNIGFMGLFFSTFFGGHTDDWASPKDQYAYFRDFKMWVNN
ncbi:hypothetical protein IAR55_001821 [Kwoniella newhampshirensis]|uniref:Polysaccharide lyase 14 domain-containing protein n=1 Tax=Kwoniella newhampshirensis TaxID=1651941 RepID=A0AAW0Z3A2_9TREE